MSAPKSSRYEKAFAALAAKGEGAFVPFIMLSDPSPEVALEIIDTVVKAGADALELGVPFSDPVADGPAIQAAHVLLLATWRLLRGPTVPDRILALDTMSVTAIAELMLFGMYLNSAVYFEAALLIAMLGFGSTVVLSKFVLRRDIVE